MSNNANLRMHKTTLWRSRYLFAKGRLFRISVWCVFFLLFFKAVASFAMELPMEYFPIEHYAQNIDNYISPTSKDYTKPLVSKAYQKTQFKKFYNYYYRDHSPWNPHEVKKQFAFLKKAELQILDTFNNQHASVNGQHYAENFRKHDLNWWSKIQRNMQLNAINDSRYQATNRAIVVQNTFARALPENSPDFFHFSRPGQGFPFDNLQEAVIWVGTPLYILHTTQDKSWSLVLTPDGYFSWVKTETLARVSAKFIYKWQHAAQNGLIAITKTNVSILDTRHRFQFTSYIGAVFPRKSSSTAENRILFPVKNSNNQAVMNIGLIDKQSSKLMPWDLSKKNMVIILKQLQNRPYGWGGSFFYNDCSQELKSLYTPFGLWLPRNSEQQSTLPKTLDLSKAPLNIRIKTLQTKGHPLLTLIYVGGHIMLYVGNNGSSAITYQATWGLDSIDHKIRYIIGQSLFFPLKAQYHDAPGAISQANKDIFKLVYLDAM